ncbi:GTPase HflX [Spirochaeta africana]|nr:GTPase HflX [Spirochaeta africana]
MIEFTEREPDGAILVGTTNPHRSLHETEDLLNELSELCSNIDLEPRASIIAPLSRPQPRFFVGSGKVDEILQLAEEYDCSCIVFDEELSPSQQRNLERHTKLAVIDRREVILEIFKQRATTQEAVLQVQLASLEYSLPRLTRAWTHLSRQRGGAKGTRGEGEKQLEVDRRLVQRRITAVKRELAQVEEHRATMRKKRESIPMPTGALVGYTNAGKSTLLEYLSGAELGSENKLFATLDPTTKRIELADAGPVLLTDTVGFVRNLPHELVDAFHSTLEETLHASFIVHVVDAAAPNAREQYEAVNAVLRELGAEQYPTIVALNKADLAAPDQLFHPRTPGPVVEISAKTGAGIERLTATIERLLEHTMNRTRFRFPVERSDLPALLHRSGRVLSERYEDDAILVEALVPPRIHGKLQEYVQKKG